MTRKRKPKRKKPGRRRNARLEPRRGTEIDDARVRELLKRPSDFGYSGDIEGMFETWTLGPVIEHRDSDILTKANRKALEQWLESDSSLSSEYQITGANHWAVGWVDHLSYRVLDDRGYVARPVQQR